MAAWSPPCGATSRARVGNAARPTSRAISWQFPPKDVRGELHEHPRALFAAPDPATARTLLRQIVATYAARAPKAIVAVLEAGFDDATAGLALPEPSHRR